MSKIFNFPERDVQALHRLQDLARVRAENERLKERQISTTELEALRADHAALPRLRAELEALKPRPPAAGR